MKFKQVAEAYDILGDCKCIVNVYIPLAILVSPTSTVPPYLEVVSPRSSSPRLPTQVVNVRRSKRTVPIAIARSILIPWVCSLCDGSQP